VSAVSPARLVAARILERVEARHAFADLALDAEIERESLSPRDAALATEIVFGVLRWRRYLDALLTPHARRPLDRLDTRVLTLLRMTAYQIIFLERVPAWAAVNDAVALSKTRAKPGVPEFVNAVLRAFVRRGERERRPALPKDPLDALAVRCSFPTWLAARWVTRYGAEEAERLMRAMNDRPPMTVRVNTLRTTRERARERLRLEEGLAAEPTRWAPEGLVVEHGGPPGTWKAFVDGDLIVQDEASMLVSRLLEPRPGETIADVCAAPGTKTTHIAALMGDAGRVIACDPDRARLALVGASAARLGLAIVETREGPVETVAPALADACDRVLVDAPCSNLGVLRRNPDAKWRRTPEDLGRARARQRAILAAATTMVRPGGCLVYATCSLEPEENDDVWGPYLETHRNWQPDPPADSPILPDHAGALRSTPSVHGTDGFTAIRLRRHLRRRPEHASLTSWGRGDA
jgi:16S rRNA (cytosine967-C5)-methyltransferase